MTYPLCEQTVTRYRKGETGVQREVFSPCFFSARASRKKSGTEVWEENEFLLIVPGDPDLLPGDRIVPGTGAEVTGWEELLQIPGMCETDYVRRFPPYHTEAGRGRYLYV